MSMFQYQKAILALGILVENYKENGRKKDVEYSEDERFVERCQTDAAFNRDMRLATWLNRQAFFSAAWTLWEGYAREYCLSVDPSFRQLPNESFPQAVGRCTSFADGV